MTELLKLLKINPELPARTVFRYLKHEPGPHALTEVKNKALIACTARSGSSLLQVCLDRYGLDAKEFFNVEGMPKQAFESGTAKTTREYADLLARTAVPNGHFAAKGAYVALLFLYYMNEVPNLSSYWKIVFLRRRNIIRQAISMDIAATTQQWTFDMRPRETVRIDDYSFDRIMKHMDVVNSENQIWERIFSLLDIRPHRLFYEDFTSAIDSHTEEVARFIGIDTSLFPNAKAQVPRLKSQSTEINVEWERRVRKEIGERSTPSS